MTTKICPPNVIFVTIVNNDVGFIIVFDLGQDAIGKTPIHIAIENQHPVIISLLLSHPGLDLTVRDRQGFTPFAAAMTTKNNKAAQAILNRESTAAEQVLLHKYSKWDNFVLCMEIFAF